MLARNFHVLLAPLMLHGCCADGAENTYATRSGNHHSNSGIKHLPWTQILAPWFGFPQGSAKRAHWPLRVRAHGPLRDYEVGESFQRASRWCVDEKPEPFSWDNMLCVFTIDFGISAMIAAKSLQETAMCAALGQLGDGGDLWCLLWLLLRFFLPPGVFPSILRPQLHYSEQTIL